MMALLVLRDREVTISEWDRRFLLQSAMGITLALTVLGGAVIVVFYLNPVMISPAKHTTLFYSKTIDFNALGYPESDIVARYLVSSTWSSVTTLAYMTIVLGGSLMATIYRLGSGGQVRPDEAPAPAVAPAPAKRRSKRPRVDARYRPGWLAGRRILQPVRSSAGILPIDKRFVAAFGCRYQWAILMISYMWRYSRAACPRMVMIPPPEGATWSKASSSV